MNAEKKLSAVKTLRREKILDVAEALFLQQGFRATTMEGVANAANMSKVTVYGYFNDKDALFIAVAERLADRLWQSVEQALHESGALKHRVITALIAKHKMIHEMVRASSFSTELFATKDNLVGAIFKRLDIDIQKSICDALEDSSLSPGKAEDLARLIFGAAQGIANRSPDVATMEADIATLITAVLQ